MGKRMTKDQPEAIEMYHPDPYLVGRTFEAFSKAGVWPFSISEIAHHRVVHYDLNDDPPFNGYVMTVVTVDNSIDEATITEMLRELAIEFRWNLGTIKVGMVRI